MGGRDEEGKWWRVMEGRGWCWAVVVRVRTLVVRVRALIVRVRALVVHVRALAVRVCALVVGVRALVVLSVGVHYAWVACRCPWVGVVHCGLGRCSWGLGCRL